MNSKLIRRLRREAVANPAKAAALVAVVVVAIWFWAPLVMRWCSPAAVPADESAAPVAAADSVTPSVASVAQSVPTSVEAVSEVPWQQLVKAIDQDPRMQPSTRFDPRRNPFGPSAAELAAAKRSQQITIKRSPPPELLPADAGLVLNSTLIGSGRRMAMIGGEPYVEGDAVPTSQSSETFQLVEIFARQVVLERHGKQFGLEIKTTSHDTAAVAEADKPHLESSPGSAPRRKPAIENAKPPVKQIAPFAKFNTSQ